MSSPSGKNKRSLTGKLNWGMTWLAMKILGGSLHYRLKGDGAAWLQDVPMKNINVLNRVDFLQEMTRGEDVLHIGFSDHPFTEQRIKDGTLLQLQLKDGTKSLTGIDADEHSVELYRQLTGDDKVYTADICSAYPQAVIDSQPTLLLLTEVLEHLQDPYKAVAVLHNSFPAGTKVLVTVPNYLGLDNLAAGLHNTESIHPDHNWYFSPYTLRRLFDDKRFTLDNFQFGMYYQPGVNANAMLRRYPYYGDCIMAIFTIVKPEDHA